MPRQIPKNYLLLFSEADQNYAKKFKETMEMILDRRIRNSLTEQHEPNINVELLEIKVEEFLARFAVEENTTPLNQDRQITVFLNPQSTREVADICKLYSKFNLGNLLYIDKEDGLHHEMNDGKIHSLHHAENPQFVSMGVIQIAENWVSH